MTTQYVTAFRAMGCKVNVWLDTDEDGQTLLQQAPAWIEDIEASLSRFRPESELSRLNQHLNTWMPVSDVLMDNLLAAKQAARITNGLYNPLVLDALVAAGYDRSFDQISDSESPAHAAPVLSWRDIGIDFMERRACLPARMDLGGVAKGWTAQTIAERLAAYGACLVDIGGDIAVRGAPANQPGWEIQVDDPAEPDTIVAKVCLTNGSIVTSGIDYRRWRRGGQLLHHLIDPRTGSPANTDVLSVTVIHSDASAAEAYAKAILVMGSQVGLEWLQQQWESAAMVVRTDGMVLATRSFTPYMVQEGVTL